MIGKRDFFALPAHFCLLSQPSSSPAHSFSPGALTGPGWCRDMFPQGSAPHDVTDPFGCSVRLGGRRRFSIQVDLSFSLVLASQEDLAIFHHCLGPDLTPCCSGGFSYSQKREDLWLQETDIGVVA